MAKIKSIRHLADIIKNKLLVKQLKNFNSYRDYFINKYGIEIGGPSAIFRKNNVLPLYPVLGSLDGSNYAGNTLWSVNQNTYEYCEGKPSGKMFIAESTELRAIEDNTYDFLLASHVIEHLANPIKAVKEWSRIVKPGGSLLIIAPDPEKTFDHRRSLTPFAHIKADYESDMKEDDTTHLNEILRLHDLKRDYLAGSFENFRQRCLNNLTYRGMHHHLFSEKLFRDITAFCGLKLIRFDKAFPYHLIALIANVK